MGSMFLCPARSRCGRFPRSDRPQFSGAANLHFVGGRGSSALYAGVLAAETSKLRAVVADSPYRIAIVQMFSVARGLVERSSSAPFDFRGEAFAADIMH